MSRREKPSSAYSHPMGGEGGDMVTLATIAVLLVYAVAVVTLGLAAER